jgi:hypothetical protein
VIIGKPVPRWYGMVICLPLHFKIPTSRRELKPSVSLPVPSAKCLGHRRRIVQSGTYKTFGSATEVGSPSSDLNTYSAAPIPFTSYPDAIPCSFVGCTGEIGEMKSLFEFVIVTLAPVSTTKCTSSGVNCTGRP